MQDKIYVGFGISLRQAVATVLAAAVFFSLIFTAIIFLILGV